jgi:hypothetical protein
MEDKKQLEVGDLICERHHGRPQKIMKITRVSPSQAFVGDRLKLKRIIRNSDEWLTEIGAKSWSTTAYYLATEEDHFYINLKNAKGALNARFEEVFSKLSMADCEAIMAVLDGIQ